MRVLLSNNGVVVLSGTMPGNTAYQRLLGFLMPSWDLEKVDVDLRIAAVIGMQGTGKTTLAQTIANDLARKYGDEFVALYGFWLHKLLPEAREAKVLNNKKYVLVILEDATAVLHISQTRKLLNKDMVYFWRLRHELKEAGIRTYTARVCLLILAHSYMTLSKYLRNAHALIIKSMLPVWQRFEHEDITLRWLDNAIVKELTRMRFSNKVDDVEAALRKALVVYLDKHSEIISYKAVKQWPKQFFENLDKGVEEEDKEEKLGAEERKTLMSITKYLVETGIPRSSIARILIGLGIPKTTAYRWLKKITKN